MNRKPTSTQKSDVKENYVEVNFTLRPHGTKSQSDLFAWRTYLNPMIQHFRLEERWIKTNFNLIEGTIRVKVAIRTNDTANEVRQRINELLQSENDVLWN